MGAHRAGCAHGAPAAFVESIGQVRLLAVEPVALVETSDLVECRAAQEEAGADEEALALVRGSWREPHRLLPGLAG